MNSPLLDLVNAINKEKERQKKIQESGLRKKKLMKYESYALLLILFIFIFGLFYNVNKIGITGLVTGISNESQEVIIANEVIEENKTLIYDAHNITSIKVSGYIIGNGSVKILYKDKVVLDSTKLGKNLLTGFVISDIGNNENNENIEEKEQESNQENNQEIDNIQERNEINDSDLTDNNGVENNLINNNEETIDANSNISEITEELQENNTETNDSELEVIETEINETREEIENVEFRDINETINESVNNINEIFNESNKFIINETEFIYINITINETLNETIEPMMELKIIRFDNYCLETCKLQKDNFQENDLVLTIIVEKAVLNLTSISYSYVIGYSEINETLNDTINQTLINETINDTGVIEINYTAVINQPVLWKKKINLTITNYTKLPKQAFNISVHDDKIISKIIDNNTFIDVERFNQLKKETLKQNQKVEKLNEEILEKKDIVLVFERDKDKLQKEFEDIVEITYYTDGPTAEEKTISQNRKQVVISSDMHYENVLAYTEIKESKKENIKVYWIRDNEKVLFENLNYIDTNNNGFIDKIEWVVPHLSNQTFEISIVVLNPYTYLRDNEIWVVAFNTSGIANLSISSPNANWSEVLLDNNETFDEMSFLNLSCGNNSLINDLKIVDVDNNTYKYYGLNETNSIKIKKFFVENYECNSTGYFENYMIKAGYATLFFEFENENASVFDYAYDPSAPTHDNPFITPDPAYIFNNLTCNANNVYDADGDDVINITTWYKNNVSIYLLYLPFEGNGNENKNATDYSGYGNNATVFGATWNRTGGKIGGGYSLNNSNYLFIKDTSFSNSFENGGTLMFWINPKRINDNLIVLSNECYLYLEDSGSNFKIEFDCGFSDVLGGWITDYIIPEEKWTHITIVYNSSSVNNDPIIYVNGVNVSVLEWQTPSGSIMPENSFCIGLNGGCAYPDSFNGSIDEVRLFNFSLTPLQIKKFFEIENNSLTANVIVSDETEIGDEWICSVTPNDGFSNGITKNSSIITIISNTFQPYAILNAPLNNTLIEYGNPILLNITYVDPEGVSGTIVFVNNSNSATLCTNTSIANNTKVTCAVNLDYGQQLKWYVNTSDGLTTTMNGVWNFSVFSSALPTINSVECELNTTNNWLPCSQALWNTTILRVRVNCVQGSDKISYVSYNLTNFPDLDVKFSANNASTVNGDYWIYDNTDLKISDSGEFNLSIRCVDTSYSYVSNITKWNVPWGYFNSTWVEPVSNDNISINYLKTFTSRVTCIGGECGDINVTIDPAQDNWWNTSWKYRQKLVFNRTRISETLHNFTILVVLNTSNFNYSLAKSNGYDLRFIDDDNSTELNYEIELWNTTGNSFIWVRVPVISNYSVTDSDFIWLYYNNSAALDGSNKVNTWDSNFIGVWHLKEPPDGVTGSIKDSTVYGYNYTSVGMTTSQLVDGKLGKGMVFYGSNDYLNMVLTDVYDSITEGTVEGWVYWTGSIGGGNFDDWFSSGSDANGPWAEFAIYDGTFALYIDGATTFYANVSIPNPQNNWHYLVYTVNSTNGGYSFYVDGIKKTPTVISGATTHYFFSDAGTEASTRYQIGRTAEYENEYFEGKLDEIRVSKIPRSPVWVNISYLSMIDSVISYGVREENTFFSFSKSFISTNPGATPFWTASSNPQNCTNMKADSICETTWIVNATGTINNTYEFYVIYEALNYSLYVNRNETSKINITIRNITISSYAILNNPINNTFLGYDNPILLNITYVDPGGLSGTVVFVNSSNAAVICTNSSIANNTKVTCAVNLDYGQQLKWYVNTSDGLTTTMNGVWNFSITSNTAPKVSAISILPSLPNASSDLRCYAAALDDVQTSLTVEYWWYNNSNYIYGGNTTGVSNNTNTLISTLSAQNISVGGLLNCTIRVKDGYTTSTYNSTNVTIQNREPFATLNYPLNNTVISYGNPIILNVTYIDRDGSSGTVVFVNNSNAETLCSNSSIANNTKVSCAVNLKASNELKWYVNTSDGYNNTINGVWNFSVGLGVLTPYSPIDETIVDRDSVNNEHPDYANLFVKLNPVEENVLITYKANLTMPNIEGETNIILGQSFTNSSGIANLTWYGLDNYLIKMYAGNYTWWAEAQDYLPNETRIIYLFGGLNLSYLNTSVNPNANYVKSDIVNIEMVLESLGVETRTQLNSTYLAKVNATLKDPLGQNYTIELFDPGKDENPLRQFIKNLIQSIIKK